MSNRTAVGAAEMFVPLMEAQTALDTLIKGDPIQLEISKSEANALLNKLGAIFDKNFIDLNTRQFRFPGREEVIDAHELTLLRSLVEKFETAFVSELSRKAVFTVPKLGLFDTYELTEHADNQFSEETLRIMPQHVRSDIRAAGRALAFGLSAACCFHLVRASEDLLSKYSEAYGGGTATKSNVLWHESLPRLIAMSKSKSSNGPDPRILTMLSDMESRIRPALHSADHTISINDATIFFNTTSSMISLMVEALAKTGKNHNRIKAAQEKLEDVHHDDEADAEDTDAAQHSKSA
ncbi:MAG: hypothetical protein K2Q32_06405 [Alphaproteobacteria bacterium]|nr:hypothetical protein [Alphaproteobacteria bacterium]